MRLRALTQVGDRPIDVGAHAAKPPPLRRSAAPSALSGEAIPSPERIDADRWTSVFRDGYAEETFLTELQSEINCTLTLKAGKNPAVSGSMA